MDNDIYGLLSKRIKGVASGIKSISFENGILKFTTNDNIVINVTVPNMHTHSNQAILDKLNVVNGKLYYDGVLIDGHEHSNKTALDGITNEKVTKWDNKSEFSGNYNDLTGMPAEFKPSSHRHDSSEIDNLPTGGGSSVSVVDNLTSTSTTSALSANQGRVIKSSLENIVTRVNDHITNHPSNDISKDPIIVSILQRLGILENYHKTKVYNIPRLNLSGDTTGISADVKVTLDAELIDVYGDAIFNNKKCKLAWQGNSSIGWIKKNFSISLLEQDGATKYKHKFFEDVDANDGYHLKSDWEDAIRMRNNVSVSIAEKMYSKKLPSGARSTMQGFPIQIFINEQYQGLYHFNTKQHYTVYKLDKTNPNHLMYRANGDALTGRFKALSNNNESDIANDWEDRFPETNTVGNREKLNRMIQWVMDCENNITKFKNEINQYFDKEYLLKYTILVYIGGMWDNLSNNFNLVTYDGLIWYPTFYDCDSTWGYHYSSTCPISANYIFPDNYMGGDSILFNLVMSAYKDNELKEVYQNLRDGVLSYENIIYEFDNELASITQAELTKDLTQWSANHTNYDITATKQWIQNRLTYVDSQFEVIVVPVSDVTLNKNSTTIVNGRVEQLTATIYPTNATNKGVNWTSSDTSVVTVSATGLVTAVGVGSATITVTTTDNPKSANCTVVVSEQADSEQVDYVTDQLNIYINGKGLSGNSTIVTDIQENNNFNLSGFKFDGSDGYVNNGFKFNGGSRMFSVNAIPAEMTSFTLESYLDFDDIRTFFPMNIYGWNGVICGIEGSVIAYEGAEIGEIKSTITPIVGTKYHICVVFDSANSKSYMYVNGVKACEGGFKTIDPSYNIYLGATVNGDYFKGTIYKFRLYTKALSESEINANYNECLNN